MDLAHVTDYVAADRASFTEGDAWLAGGSWLFSEPQPGVRRLLDLHAFGWPALTEHDDRLEVAATCTIEQLAQRPGDGAAFVLPCCQALLGSFKVWHVATVGGNLCCALPAGPMTSLMSALDATAELWRAGERRALPAAGFVTGPGENALRPGELLRALHVPRASLTAPLAFRRVSLTALGRSAAVVVGRRDGDGLVLSVTASVPAPVVLRFGDVPDAGVVAEAVDELEFYEDVHGDPRWRRAMTRRLATEVAEELAA